MERIRLQETIGGECGEGWSCNKVGFLCSTPMLQLHCQVLGAAVLFLASLRYFTTQRHRDTEKIAAAQNLAMRGIILYPFIAVFPASPISNRERSGRGELGGSAPRPLLQSLSLAKVLENKLEQGKYPQPQLSSYGNFSVTTKLASRVMFSGEFRMVRKRTLLRSLPGPWKMVLPSKSKSSTL